MQRLWNLLFERSIMLWLAATLLLVSAIGIGGMAMSVLVAEQVQGSGSAINVAGSLRRLSHRMGSIVLSDAENRVFEHTTLREAVVNFEATLQHEALTTMLDKQPDSPYAATYEEVQAMWKTGLKPQLLEQMLTGPDLHPIASHNRLLLTIDEFVERINIMVAQLEADTEQRIRRLRITLWAALLLTTLVLLGGIFAIHHRVVLPLKALLAAASRIAGGDFTARTPHLGRDELGRLGQTFNFMAEAVSRSHGELESRVREKTAELTRSNRSLALLYNAIARLHHAPTDPETYRSVLNEVDPLLNLVGSTICLRAKHDGPATLLATSLPTCGKRGSETCNSCINRLEHGTTVTTDRHIDLPLRDKDGLYGLMRLALPEGQPLEDWQAQLLSALTRHMGTALGLAQKAEQERLLALQEERSIIARELHDSIAQSLSYMKIQASLLQPVLSDPERRTDAEVILRDLREGISAAYRQLRELLATFRLKMEGDFIALLAATVDEFVTRSGIAIELETRLADCRLTPNQEMHTLQIIREALSNVLRHAQATRAWVRVIHRGGGVVEAMIEDDGIGIDRGLQPGGHHYGLTIMRERACGLHGQIQISARETSGTQVLLRFNHSTQDQQ